MFKGARNFPLLVIFLLAAMACVQSAWAQGPTPGQNVNMVSGTTWPFGDPYLQRQNEPSLAVSTRNSRHLLAAANDYRTVDLPLTDVVPTELAGDAWLGVFKSGDGGATWQSTLIPGAPQDQSPTGLASPLKGFTTASDAVIRAATSGLFHISGIAFNRGTNQGVVFVAQYIDLDNKANGAVTVDSDATRFIRIVAVRSGNNGQFLDKPWLAVDIPRGTATCTITVPEKVVGPDGTVTVTQVTQTIPAGNAYLAWTEFVGNATLTRSKLYFARSTDCGATWGTPTKLSESYAVNQGSIVQVDPSTGFVYVAWRTFAAANTSDGINIVKSTDGGQTFTKGIQVVTLPSFDPTHPTAPSFFDQGMNFHGTSAATSFRTNAFPALGIDGGGRVYLAWSQRGVEPNGDARIMMATSTDGLTWSAPFFAIDNDNTALARSDDFGNLFVRGHQIMPQITTAGGKVMVLYHDLRLDHTTGLFHPNVDQNGNFASDAKGRFYLEKRAPKGELAPPTPNPSAVFTPFIDDFGLTGMIQRRHTIELMVAQASPSLAPIFQTARVSSYRFGLRGDETGTVTDLSQLQVNPPNLPLFVLGHAAFFGDYIDIAGQMFVPTTATTAGAAPTSGSGGGGWAFNIAPLQAPEYHAVWTDNRDVRPPQNGDWTTYTPVGAGGPSTFDPTKPRPACISGQEGMRNQNIYTSLITQGLLVSSPDNSKPLSTTLQRAFVVLVQNFTNFEKTFRLTIANQPPGSPTSGFASFTAGKNNPGPTPPAGPPTPPSPLTTVLDVAIPAHSGIARPVFAVSSGATATITVNVDEISGLGAPGLLPGGLSSFVVLNADSLVPPPVNPDGAPAGTDIATVEVYNPNLSNPNTSNPNTSNPNTSNPNLSNPNTSNPNTSNPNTSNPDIDNPNTSNPNTSNPNTSNPNTSNPNTSNPNLSNQPVSDGTYTVSNTGNTSASYRVKLVGNAPTSNARLQLIVNKTYQTPIGLNCQLMTENQNTLQTNISNPVVEPTTNFDPNPNLTNGADNNATVELAPGESALITLRGINVTCKVGTGPRCQGLPGFPLMEDIVQNLTPVVISQAANTNDPTNTPTVAVPGGVAILSSTLPDGVVGGVGTKAYNASVQAIGQKPPLVWSVVSGSGALPGGLTLNPSTGVISGTPTTAGTFSFTIQVTDATPSTASRAFTITINDPVVLFFGAATDLAGDALATNGDIVSGSVTVLNNGTAKFSVRFAPGGFDPATTQATFLLDTDQNPATGRPGIDGACSIDTALIGSEFLVSLGPGNQTSILQPTGCVNGGPVGSSQPVTIFSDGMDATIPMSLLGNDDGLMNFKVESDFLITPPGGFSARIDVMPDVGVPPVSTAPPGPPIGKAFGPAEEKFALLLRIGRGERAISKGDLIAGGGRR